MSYFVATEGILEAVEDASPNDRNFSPPSRPRGMGVFEARRVGWLANSNYIVPIEADKILFMEGNLWNFGHAAAILDHLRHGGEHLEMPAARVNRITADYVKSTEKAARDGDLEERYGMTKPWTRRDIGTYYAQLVDGNHRAAAAMAYGEPFLYVYVGENYRQNIYKKDWARPSR